LWAYENSRGATVPIRQITDRFLRADESTRARPDPARVGEYRRLQELFNRLVTDLGGAFRQHRALLG
ncbi:MAG: hypothetical protein ACRDH2_15540, partial [Anaerolineales bacterium]